MRRDRTAGGQGDGYRASALYRAAGLAGRRALDDRRGRSRWVARIDNGQRLSMATILARPCPVVNGSRKGCESNASAKRLVESTVGPAHRSFSGRRNRGRPAASFIAGRRSAPQTPKVPESFRTMLPGPVRRGAAGPVPAGVAIVRPVPPTVREQDDADLAPTREDHRTEAVRRNGRDAGTVVGRPSEGPSRPAEGAVGPGLGVRASLCTPRGRGRPGPGDRIRYAGGGGVARRPGACGIVVLLGGSYRTRSPARGIRSG